MATLPPPDNFDADSLAKVLLSRFNLSKGDCFNIAYSGGRDSHVLLHSMHQVRESIEIDLTAFHVDHGLHDQSSDWAQHCKSICNQLNISFRQTELHLSTIPGRSLEELARLARYEWLRSNVNAGEILLTAHHRRDQAETLLLQLLRGAGIAGMASMPDCVEFGAGIHIRPLLSFSSRALAEYAAKNFLHWIEDSSNLSIDIDRNYLRLEVLPILTRRWPGVEAVVARSASHLSDGRLLLEELAQQDLDTVKLTEPLLKVDYGTVLDAESIAKLSPSRQRNLLRFWIRASGYRAPSTRQMGEIGRSLIDRESSGGMVSWDQVQLRRHKNILILVPAVTIQNDLQFDSSGKWSWNPCTTLVLQQSGLKLVPRNTRGRGLASKYLHSSRLELRPRLGGERCRLPGRQHHHKLKKLYQVYDVPRWERERIPLIYIDNKLAALPGYWVCHPYSAAPGEESIWFDLLLDTSINSN